MRLLNAFLAVLAFMACGINAETSFRRRAAVVTTPNPTVPSASSPPVILQSFSYDADTNVVSGSIWIKNIAFSKAVQGFYSTPTAEWSTTQFFSASYSSPADNGFEVWTFSATPAKFGPGSQFYLKYTVSGNSYYDNNFTKNYLIKGSATPTDPSPGPQATVIQRAPPSADGPNVIVQQYSFTGGILAGTIWVKNLAFNKAVTLIASTTTGSWGPSVTASYTSGSVNSYEIWSFSGSLPGVGTGSQFYIKYDVNGVSYYDNNGGVGKNYAVVGSISPASSIAGFASDIDTFFTNAIPNIKKSLLAAINPAGTVKGVVVAAPKIQIGTTQNYFYHWIRDGALVMDAINELYKEGDSTLSTKLEEYIAFSRSLQTIQPPALTGFGQAKFEVSGKDFTGDWCRPQNDGPGLRASGIIRYAKAYLAKGGSLSQVINWYNGTQGVIKPDLDYVVANSYDANGCDLWEETRGLHFFTQMMQRRSLKEGQEFATFLGDTATAARYAAAAAGLDDYVKKYWNPSVGSLYTTLNARQLDAAIPLTAIHGYNNDGLFGPADDRMLNSVFLLANGFIGEYPLNTRTTSDDKGRPLSVAIGRYYGDTYNGINSGNQGNPWYLATAAVAETYYRAVTEYIKVGSISVTPLNRNFIVGDRPAGLQAGNIPVGTYAKGSAEFNAIIGAFTAVADSYIRRAAFHGDVDYRFGEQFLRTTGTANAQGVRDLTWSYASLITANLARKAAKAAVSA
ncbi:glycoside hydrolase 15 protein [Phlyctochytrium planicorne]|nr:glycoside hydrolase 15 protein [Phlyctochytrium planicorne]